ncbi:hypothetical protein BaRGS_00036528 [Batillaria attramentaria]|uniref:TIR domain-containing protein n=1 Tax=Batillaria attramentaria TaxID=370345 RepID=A0ABD0JCV4_9CAEN
MAMRDENIQYLREQQATKVLQGFLQSKSVDIKLTAVAGLADISTDEEAEHTGTSEDVVQFLLSILDNALDDEEHDYKGWSGTEIVRGKVRNQLAYPPVAQLSDNSLEMMPIKKLLVEQGVLPLLTKGIQSDLEDEKTESIEALWRLSFCKENHPAFVENGELMDLVQKVKYDRQEKDSCRAAAEGILFQLRTELDRREKTQYWAKEFLKRVDFQRKAKIASSAKVKPTTEKTPTAVSQAGHVMLSYNWGHQPLVKKIHDQLVERGIKVWMDIKKMRGSTRTVHG